MRRTFSVIGLALVLCACEGGGRLVIQVRSDLPPGRGFAAVLVEITTPEGEPVLGRRVVAEATDTWGRGARVLDASVEPGEYRVIVSARDAEDRVVVARPVRVAVAAEARVVTVLLTVSCAGVSCPSAGGDPALLACVGGRCATESCVEESTEGCPDPECTNDDECPMLAPCATRECTSSGTCFSAIEPGACPAGQACDAVRGCVPDAPTTDYRACSDDSACDAGEICAIEHTRRCRATCTTDAECAPDQQCGHDPDDERDHCVGDTCDLLTGAGCPVGTTCSVYLASVGAGTAALRTCRPVGHVPENGVCANTASCRTGHCARDVRPFARTCEAYCAAHGDCPSGQCLLASGSGLCAPMCDPRDGSGCAATTRCYVERLRDIDDELVTTTQCRQAGTVPLLGLCSFNEPCVVGAWCVGLSGADSTCQPICEVAEMSCTCTGLFGLMVDGVALGFCT